MRAPRSKFLFLIVGVLALGWYGVDRFSKSIGVNRPMTSAAIREPASPAKAPPPVPVTAPVAPPVAPVPPSKTATTTKAPAAVKSAEPSYPPMSLEEVLQPNNLFHDAVFGVAVTYPEGWAVRDARRWGENNRENTVFFKPPEPLVAAPSMYYQKFRDTPPDREHAEEYLRNIAQGKEDARNGNGQNDYKNVPGSYEYKEINGRPALSYSAVYTQGEQVMTEYFVRILGEQGYVMFFTRGNPEDVQALVPAINQMAGTVRTP